MATPAEEPFAASTVEAVQTAVMAYRLVMAVSDAVRRATQRREQGREEPLPLADQAQAQTAGEVREHLPQAIATGLMGEADWPVMAQQLAALREAGVDLGAFLPRVGAIAVQVRDEVAARQAAAVADDTQQWRQVVEETMSPGVVREAILASPTWPEIARSMQQLHDRGVDVRAVLAAAHTQGVEVDRAIGQMAAAARSRPSVDALRSYGPLTVGVQVPVDLDLSDRGRALAQLGVQQQDNRRFVRLVREALPQQGPGRQAADALVAHRQWPLVAARMGAVEASSGRDRMPLGERLRQMAQQEPWREARPGQVGEQMVRAVARALSSSGSSVVTAAARSRSVTRGSSARPSKKAPTASAAASRGAPAPVPRGGRSRGR